MKGTQKEKVSQKRKLFASLGTSWSQYRVVDNGNEAEAESLAAFPADSTSEIHEREPEEKSELKAEAIRKSRY